jgi:hypothetical protein
MLTEIDEQGRRCAKNRSLLLTRITTEPLWTAGHTARLERRRAERIATGDLWSFREWRFYSVHAAENRRTKHLSPFARPERLKRFY